MQIDMGLDKPFEFVPELHAWRTRALNGLLAVATVAAVPLVLLVIFEATRHRERWPAALISLVVYLCVVGLAILHRLSFHLRAWSVLLLGYAAGVSACARAGLAGNGRLYLLALPAIALVLVGSRAGLVVAALSLLTCAAFAATAPVGWTAEWPVRWDDTWLLPGWGFGAVAFAATLAALLAVQFRFNQRQEAIATENARLLRAAQAGQALCQAAFELFSGFAYAVRVGPDGTPVGEWMTEPFTRITGFTLDEIRARGGWESLIHPDDVSIARQHLQTCLSGHSHASECRIVTKEGEVRWIRYYGCPVWDNAQGRVVRIYGAAQDVTEHKRAEEALIATQARLQHLLVSSPAVIYSCEPGDDYAATFVSENVKVQLGYEPRAFVDDPRFWADRIHPEDAPRVFAELARVFERGHHFQEYRFRRKDGAYRWMYDELRLVRDPRGEPLEIVGYWIDVTERKRAAEELQQHTERLRVLYEIDQAILAARSPEAIAQAALRHVRRLVDCLGAGVVMFDFEAHEAIVLVAEVGGELTVETGTRFSLEKLKGTAGLIESLRRGEVHVFEDTRAILQPSPVVQALQAWGLRSVLSVPLVIEDQVIGFFSLGTGNPDPFASEHMHIVREVAGPLAIAIRQARLFDQAHVAREQLRRLTHQVVSAQEDERQRLSRALHDEAGQALTALGISLELIRDDLPIGFGALRHRIGDAAALADTTMEQIRLLAQDLRPPSLDAVGLGPTLEAFCRDFAGRTQLSIDCLARELPVLPDAVTICLYRFLQEALTNVAKHAHANQVCVALRYDAETVSLSVEDDGRGFDRQTRLSGSGRPLGIGLLGMQERLESLGGRLEIESWPDQGTRLVAHIPTGGLP